jgi:hypothetical protein
MNQRIRTLRRNFRYLKRGVFPPESIDEFTFGRNTELDAIDRHLKDVFEGSSRYLFLEGPYGCGKSHLLKAVEAIALKTGFAVAWVTLDGQNHALNHPTRYLHSLLENLRVSDAPVRGLSSLLSFWLRGERASQVVNWANNSTSWWPAAPILEYQAKLDHVAEVQYLRALIESRDLARKSGRLYFDTVCHRMQATASLLEAAGYRGILYLFDELETVATLLTNVRQRLLSYELLNLLTDRRKHSNCMFVLAATPDFGIKLESDRVIAEYYANRYPEGFRFIQKWRTSSVESLSLSQLRGIDKMSLCQLLRRNHEEAFMWDMAGRFSDELIQAFIRETERLGMGMREVVKAFVHLLEIAEQHRSTDVDGALQVMSH